MVYIHKTFTNYLQLHAIISFCGYLMKGLRAFFYYINPLERLGNKKYSLLFPFFGSLISIILLELYFNLVVKNPSEVGLVAILLSFGLVIYFSFRDGIRAAALVTAMIIIYYFFLIISLHYRGQQFISGVDTTLVLGIVYLVLGGLIGWLKQTIDTLIEHEADEKRRLQTIIQQLPVGILITDNKGGITQGNKQAEIILGLKIPIGFQVGSRNLVPSEHKGKPFNPSRTPLLHVLQTGKAIVGKEFLLQRQDGRNINLQVSAAPIHNNAGRIIAAALIFSDITQQKEIELRKDDFVNMASHELKTPLTSMKLYIDVLMEQIALYHDEKATHILTNIKGQTLNLQELVNDLLDVSRLQTGKLSFKKEKFQLDTLITDTIEQLQGASAEQKIIFEQKRPVYVSGDSFRIYQVITNLIGNAIKYSGGNGDIIITLQRTHGTAKIGVQDSGIGIDKNHQKKIFDRLYQVTDPKEKTFPGFGMGLYISKEIVKKHKGRIWVESEKGKGSTFYFTLPLPN